jgi:hypothetical protein
MKITDKKLQIEILSLIMKKKQRRELISTVDMLLFTDEDYEIVYDLYGNIVCEADTYYSKLLNAVNSFSSSAGSSVRNLMDFAYRNYKTLAINTSFATFLQEFRVNLVRIDNSSNQELYSNNRQRSINGFILVNTGENYVQQDEKPVVLPDTIGAFEFEELADHIVTKYMNIEPSNFQYKNAIKNVFENLKRIKTDKNEI